MKKKILIVEAGSEYQKRHLIEETKRLPYEFYLLQTGFFEGANGWVSNWFDQGRIIDVDSMEPEVIYSRALEYATGKNMRFDGIMTFWEGFVPITHYLQTRFKLPLICNGNIRCLRHKGMMRDCAGKSLMRQPKYHVLKSGDAVDDVMPQRKYPLIVKPAEMAASLAVTKACNDEELHAAIKLARTIDYPGYAASYRDSFNLSSEVLIEEYIGCDYEISVEGVVYHGQLNIAAVCQKLLQPEPYFWEYGEITPPNDLNNLAPQRLKIELQSVVTALQLYNCSVHAEIRVDGEKLYFIEIGARIGGFAIPEIVSLSTGVNLMAIAARVSCDDGIDIIEGIKATRHAGDYSFNSIHSPVDNGILFLRQLKTNIESLVGVKSLSVRDEIEDTIFGDMIAVAASTDELSECFEKAKQMLMRRYPSSLKVQ